MFKFLNLYIFKYLLLSFPVLFFVFLGFFAPQKTFAFTLSKPSLGPSLGMVGYWSFDGKDTVGGTIYDRSGNNNHGSALNYATTTFFSAGKIGQALNFDAVNDYVNVGDPADGDLDFDVGNFSVSFWVYRIPNATSNLRVLSKGATTDTADEAGFAFSASDTSMLFIINPSGTRVTSNGVYTSNNWHHVVATVIRGENRRLYIDAVLNDTDATSASGSVSGDKPFQIGGRDNGLSPWSGKIDDVRIYNRALSASEIKQLYNIGAGIKQNVSIKPEPLSRGLVGYWSFDGKDTVGGTIYDRSGNNNHGSAVGYATSTFFSVGKIGQALKFDGVNDRVNLGDPSTIQFDIDDPFSTTFWVKAPLHNTGYNYAFLSKTNGIHGLGWYVWSWQSTDLVYFTFGTASGGGGPNYSVNSSSIIADNKWHYVTATYTGNSNQSGMKLYVDGVLVATGSNSAISTSILNANTLTINGFDGTTHDTGIGPSIDDVRIYNRALSASEIKQLYNLGADTKQNVSIKPEPLSRGLVGYWSFDGKDTVGGTIYDRSGNNNHGSAVGYATTTFFSAGKIGQALNFDGVDDYVRLPASSTLVPNVNTWTISFWFKASQIGSASLGNRMIAILNSAANSLILFALGSDNQLKFFYRNATPSGVTNIVTNVSTNTWYHAVATYNGTSYLVYVNGASPTTYTDTIDTASTDLALFASSNPPPGNSFSGKIDDVRIYNRALSASEVLQLYNMGR